MAVISVVIPAYNAGGFIKRTIDSVLAQTYRDYEVIVVDDGSTDNTAEVVKSYAGKVRYIHQENAGDGPARNTGIRAAKGDWIAFLDHDDEWLPEKLRLQMELLDRNPGLRWCGTNYHRVCGARRTTDGNRAALSRALRDSDYFEDFFTAVHEKGCGLITSTMLVRRGAFEQAGVFGSGWLQCADLDMWWRIAYCFPRIGYLPEPLAIVHLGAQHAVSTKLRLESKRGEEARRLISLHLESAKEHGMLEQFRPLAQKVVMEVLVTAVYHGFKADARKTVRQFPELLPWYWRLGAYILTIFPKLTAKTVQALAYIAYVFGFEKQVTRRWIRADQGAENGHHK